MIGFSIYLHMYIFKFVKIQFSFIKNNNRFIIIIVLIFELLLDCTYDTIDTLIYPFFFFWKKKISLKKKWMNIKYLYHKYKWLSVAMYSIIQGIDIGIFTFSYSLCTFHYIEHPPSYL